MITLKVSQQEALARIHRIPHAKAKDGAHTYWRIRANGEPEPRSVCWLYCWAKTGMNSAAAAREARNVFDAIFNVSFSWFDKRVDHEWAREARYAGHDITAKLEEQLSR